MNSAPASTGFEKSGRFIVYTRPPIRSLASSRQTDVPFSDKTLAAIKPAAPAPIIITSESLILRIYTYAAIVLPEDPQKKVYKKNV
jgi:hypothetical protein